MVIQTLKVIPRVLYLGNIASKAPDGGLTEDSSTRVLPTFRCNVDQSTSFGGWIPLSCIAEHVERVRVGHLAYQDVSSSLWAGVVFERMKR